MCVCRTSEIVSHSSCRTSAILKYFCPLPIYISLFVFQYIENLDRMKRLQVLNLSNNIIERVEKLDKLLKLKELNLSMNCITKIEGLENLTNLQLLNLTGNLIEHIPIWIGKRLKSLRAFHIGRNKLESVRMRSVEAVFECKIVIFFVPISLNMCFGFTKESSH